MSARAAFRQADVQRLIRAAKAEGVSVVGYEVRPDGAVRLLTGETEEPQRDELEEWRARRDQRKAEGPQPRLKAAR